MELVDSGRVVDMVFLDFSNPFDRLSHAVFITKLRLLGVSDRLLSWIWQFLSERTLRVVVSGVEDPLEDVASVVPQGSVLNPLLFIIYGNHISSSLTCE